MIFSCYAGALMPRDDPDMNGVSHTVEITGAAFYEALGPCLTATNRLPEFPPGSNAVKVSVADVRVGHEVKTMNFTKWFEETDGSPRELSDCLNSINPRPPLLYLATMMKAKSCGPDSGREEVRSQRVPLRNLTGVWNLVIWNVGLRMVSTPQRHQHRKDAPVKEQRVLSAAGDRLAQALDEISVRAGPGIVTERAAIPPLP